MALPPGRYFPDRAGMGTHACWNEFRLAEHLRHHRMVV